jgi:hypothetical protein
VNCSYPQNNLGSRVPTPNRRNHSRPRIVMNHNETVKIHTAQTLAAHLNPSKNRGNPRIPSSPATPQRANPSACAEQRRRMHGTTRYRPVPPDLPRGAEADAANPRFPTEPMEARAPNLGRGDARSRGRGGFLLTSSCRGWCRRRRGRRREVGSEGFVRFSELEGKRMGEGGHVK